MSETSGNPAITPPPEPDHVAQIYLALGGHPVLLRIPKGRKGPSDKGWNQIRWDDTTDPEYQSDLRLGNVGVLLGEHSKLITPAGVYHLCSIDVDESESLEPFLALNPRFQETLITSGRRGANIWLWVAKDSYPKFAKLCHADDDGKPDRAKPWGEWRTDGVDAEGKPRQFQTVIYGVHPEGMRYRRISTATRPIMCDFSEIVWPDHLAAPWIESAHEKLIAEHGEPWHLSKKGVMTLNPPFWVARYAVEREILYEPNEGRFYEYGANRGLWSIDSEDAIRWKFSSDFKRVADEVGIPQLETKRTNSFLQSLVQLLKGCTERREAFRREAGVVHLSNGMLDLRVEPPILKPFGSAFMSRNQVQVALDEKAKCPRFVEQLLIGGIGRAGDIELAQKWAGQCLLGVNLTQTIMLFTGAAGTGKSTLINCISRILGEANYVGLRTEHLHQRFELFNYVGKTLLIGADVPGHFLMTEGAHVLKALVGKDVLTAEKKNGDSVTIIGDYNVGLTSNSRLKVRLDGDAGAWRRRLMIINYDRPAPSHPDPQFLEKLIASEASGILNWMIEGARKLLADIKNHGRMQLDQVQRDRVDSLLSESDSIREFVRAGLAPVSDKAVTVTTQELVAAYVHYCELRGWNPLPTRKVEGQIPDMILEIYRLARRNDIKRDGKDARGYRGLRVVPQDNDRDAEVAAAVAAAKRDEDEGGPFG